MKRVLKYISSAVAVVALGVSMPACDDWTDPKSIDLDYGTTESADPAAYAKYLANLRAYRAKPHKKVFTWFNNDDAAFGSQGQRVSALPDSVDIIVLANPEKITNQMIQEMYEARVNKGQQFSYCISYDDIKADYTLLCEELAAKRIAYINEHGENAEIPAELQNPDFIDYIALATSKKLSYFNGIGFDCIMAGFTGKSTNHMTSSELKDYMANTNAFLGIIADWLSRNEEVTLDIFCVPQYIETNMLSKARYVFFSQSLSATNVDQYTFYLNMAGENIDLSKAGMVASVPDCTGTDAGLGYFSNGAMAIVGLGDWTAAHEVGAVGVFNTGDDYFLTHGSYSNVRTLIQTVNPSAK